MAAVIRLPAEIEALVASLREDFARAGMPPEPRARFLKAPQFDVPDNPFKILLLAPGDQPVGVLSWSRDVAPGRVDRGGQRAREAREVLGPVAGSAILEPTFAGEFEGRSFEVVPWQRPLTDHLWRWRVQRWRMAPGLIRWVTLLVGVRTGPDPTAEELARRALDVVANDAALPAPIRDGALGALSRLDNGRWTPHVVVCHNDLWKGNVLLPIDASSRRTTACGFFVIDWAGARLTGFPVWDLVRIAQSLRIPGPLFKWALRRQCRVLGCDLGDARSNFLAAIGDLRIHLEHMPIERYSEVVTASYRHLERALS